MEILRNLLLKMALAYVSVKFDSCYNGKVRVKNMKCLGIAIKKNEVWYSLVEGSDMELAEILCTGKQIYRADSSKLIMDFYNIFVELLTKYQPNKVVYKLSLEVTMQQIPYMHYSLGVLNLVCMQRGVFIRERSNRWITANKKAKIIRFEGNFVDKKYKNEELAASLMAWYELEE